MSANNNKRKLRERNGKNSDIQRYIMIAKLSRNYRESIIRKCVNAIYTKMVQLAYNIAQINHLTLKTKISKFDFEDVNDMLSIIASFFHTCYDQLKSIESISTPFTFSGNFVEKRKCDENSARFFRNRIAF